MSTRITFFDEFCTLYEARAVQKYAKPENLEKCCKASIYLQTIQTRSPPSFSIQITNGASKSTISSAPIYPSLEPNGRLGRLTRFRNVLRHLEAIGKPCVRALNALRNVRRVVNCYLR